MSVQDTISNYWQIFFIAPLGFVTHKVFSLNATVKVHDSKIAALESSLNKLWEKHDETNNLLREMVGKLDEHLRK